MEAFFASTLLVALAEMGDKTQLLAMLLAARFRAPVPIILGMFAATIANHALAALAGQEAAWLLRAFWFRIAVALGFVAMGLWTLIPDKIGDEDKLIGAGRGVFMTTAISFFVVEIGDKTQIATVALAARYATALPVMLGTTLGMMIANVPVILLGGALSKKLPMRALHIAAALLFIVMGLVALAIELRWLG